ncbi:MAG: glycerate kinase [Mailhella sp.]|nr:glycerate kinase [Mailhella sp.]
MKRIVIAMDSFKGSLTSLEAGAAAREGVLRACPDAVVTVLPLADGGEGTVEALTTGLDGAMHAAAVSGPLGGSVQARYGTKGTTAFMEMAAAAGLTLVPREKRRPLEASTYGVGMMIADALRRGCRRFVIGIGGSATTDGGMGMLQALGYSFLRDDGTEAGRGAGALAAVRAISAARAMPELRDAEFRVACDVTNPLCGPNGAARVFGPQKGLLAGQVDDVDQAMLHYAHVCSASTGKNCMDAPGAGAAGGLGFAFLSFLNARLLSGAKLVMETVGLEAHLRHADIFVTGEGRLDSQTVMGKAPGEAARLAKGLGCRVIAFSGCRTADARSANQGGIDAFFPIVPGPVTLEEALDKQNASRNLADTAEQVFRLLRGGHD